MNDRAILPRRLLVAASLLIAVVAVGTAGYAVFEGWPWFDAFYMTVTTITTVGGGEPQALDVAGKWWTIAVVAFGFGALTYTVLAGFGYIIEGHLGAEVSERRMRRRVGRMRDHFILCGFGRVGREIARDFTVEGIPFVVVDINPHSLDRAEAAGYAVMSGNAADAGTLQAAGIERARGLVTAVDDDADNIYVTLSARVLKPDIFIVARANGEDAERKIRLAGANRVISPYTIGGRRMASLAMRPTAVEFVDTVLTANNGQLLLEDLSIKAGLRVDRPRARRAVSRRRRSVRARAQARRRDALPPGRRDGASRRRRAGRRRSAGGDPRARRAAVLAFARCRGFASARKHATSAATSAASAKIPSSPGAHRMRRAPDRDRDEQRDVAAEKQRDVAPRVGASRTQRDRKRGRRKQRQLHGAEHIARVARPGGRMLRRACERPHRRTRSRTPPRAPRRRCAAVRCRRVRARPFARCARGACRRAPVRGR